MNFRSIIRALPIAACALGWLGAPAAQAGDDHYELYGWRGFYVGLLANYNMVRQNVTFPAPPPATGDIKLDGFAGTLLTGYRIPLWSERFRVGIEYDLTVGDNGATFNQYRFGSDYTMTLRGIAGFHLRPDLFVFATGGVGWMANNSASTGNHLGATGAFVLNDERSAKAVVGGVVGGGIEWDMSRAIHLRGDYLYGSYESQTADFLPAFRRVIETDAHQVRLGVVVSLQNPYDEPHGIESSDIDHDRYGRQPMK